MQIKRDMLEKGEWFPTGRLSFIPGSAEEATGCVRAWRSTSASLCSVINSTGASLPKMEAVLTKLHGVTSY